MRGLLLLRVRTLPRGRMKAAISLTLVWVKRCCRVNFCRIDLGFQSSGILEKPMRKSSSVLRARRTGHGVGRTGGRGARGDTGVLRHRRVWGGFFIRLNSFKTSLGENGSGVRDDWQWGRRQDRGFRLEQGSWSQRQEPRDGGEVLSLGCDGILKNVMVLKKWPQRLRHPPTNR